jgi:inorganic pyrophosphatase
MLCLNQGVFMKPKRTLAILTILALSFPAWAGSVDFSNYSACNEDGTINTFIEIPAGTNEKWELSAETNMLELDVKDGRPRIVQYLGYPGNYGMIPHTLLPKELGGDGDPLDILVIGGPLSRGSIAPAKLIGVLKFLDGGEQDDKLIAVLPNTALETINNFKELDQSFPGIKDIIKTWFSNYKGPGIMKFKGEGSVEDATAILDAAVQNVRE